MKRYAWVFILAFAVLIGFALGFASTIGQGFLELTSQAQGSVNVGSQLYKNQSPQPVSGYTWDNQGSATATNLGTTSITFNIPNDSNAHVLYQSVPGSTPYTAVTGMLIPPTFNSNYIGTGLFIGDSSGKYLAEVYSQSQATIYLFSYPSTTSGSSVVTNYGPSSDIDRPGYSMIYFKVLDDGTNLTWSFSTDENIWYQLYQASRTAFLSAPARMGFGGYNSSGVAASGFSLFTFGTNALTPN